MKKSSCSISLVLLAEVAGVLSGLGILTEGSRGVGYLASGAVLCIVAIMLAVKEETNESN